MEVSGDGYTDHCPKCLWGRHVDVNPGDRAANCGGAMEPVGISMKDKVYRIDYRCQKCGRSFSVKAAKDDSFGAIIKLSSGIN